MATKEQLLNQIRSYQSIDQLKGLWHSIKIGEKLNDWPSGIAFEYLILRAFELEGAKVSYAYQVDLLGLSNIEQVDGLISIPNKNLHVLVESKDWAKNTPIGPISKMRNQLQRRPAGLMGALFTSSSFTEAAIMLAHFLAPQTILLWTSDDIDYCFKNQYFIGALEAKIDYAMQEGKPDFDLASRDPKNEKESA